MSRVESHNSWQIEVDFVFNPFFGYCDSFVADGALEFDKYEKLQVKSSILYFWFDACIHCRSYGCFFRFWHIKRLRHICWTKLFNSQKIENIFKSLNLFGLVRNNFCLTCDKFLHDLNTAIRPLIPLHFKDICVFLVHIICRCYLLWTRTPTQ